MENNLFNEQLLKKYSNKIEITDKESDIIDKWNIKLEKGDLKKEISGYRVFANKILTDLLRYDPDEDILDHSKELHGSGSSEFKLKLDNKVFMIIEL